MVPLLNVDFHSFSFRDRVTYKTEALVYPRDTRSYLLMLDYRTAMGHHGLIEMLVSRVASIVLEDNMTDVSHKENPRHWTLAQYATESRGIQTAGKLLSDDWTCGLKFDSKCMHGLCKDYLNLCGRLKRCCIMT